MLATVSFGSANTGATVYYQLLNTDKTVFAARTNTGVTELVAGTGEYGVNLVDATVAGKTIVWDIDGTTKTASEAFPLVCPTTAQIVAAIELDGGKLDVIYDDWINGGRLDSILDAINTKTVNLPADPADESLLEAAIVAATSPLATTANLAIVAGYIDTEVAAILAAVDTEIGAIKTKTDYLPSVTAGQAGGLLIAGDNAATTFATLTSTGAFTCGSTVLGNTTMGTLTQAGAVAWGATTFASVVVSGTTTLTGNVTHAGKTILTDEVRITDVTTAGSLGKYLYDILADTNELAEAGGGATPAEIWTYGSRTLTQSLADVSQVMMGSVDVTRYRATTWTITWEGVGSLVARTKLWFTLRSNRRARDATSDVQIEESVGLLYLNGHAAPVAASGAIDVTDEAVGDLTVRLEAEASEQLASGEAFFDLKVEMPTGTYLLTNPDAKFVIRDVVTNAIS